MPAFATTAHQARQMLSNYSNSDSTRRSSSRKDESEFPEEEIFDEFVSFLHADEQTTYVVEIDAEENEEEIRRLSELMKRGAITTQKNSADLGGGAAAKSSAFKQELKKQEHRQKISPRAVVPAELSRNGPVNPKDDEAAEPDAHHARAAMDPVPSAAGSRIPCYQKLIPAPKLSNVSPKAQPETANPLSNATKSTEENRGFFPPSQSAAHRKRSLPIAILSKKLSLTNDDGHLFRVDVHPRIAAHSSFILLAASYLPSDLQKSFDVRGSRENDDDNGSSAKQPRDSLKDTNASALAEDEIEKPFGFEFEMDM